MKVAWKPHTHGSRWALAALILLALLFSHSIIIAYKPLRLDLTADRRYTLHETTKDLLGHLESPLHVEVYLAGDLPTGLKQLQYNLKALLEELKAISPQPITYQFINLAQEPADARKKKTSLLLKKGIEPTHLFQEMRGERTQRIVYPGLIVTYQTRSKGVMFLKSTTLLPPEAMIRQSIENLEYEISHAVAQLINPAPIRIGLIQGHGEPNALKMHGLLKALQSAYTIDSVYLAHQGSLEGYAALLITKPQMPFSEIEKYHLDQYIMQGGKVLFFLDRLRVDMDSLAQGHSFAFPLELNLDDQLFRYGIRINHDLIKDLQAGIYPIIAGKMGNQPQLKFLSWPFFPILNNFSSHIAMQHMNALYGQFMSSIEAVQAKEVIQTPLVYSSPHSICAHTPVYVDVALLRQQPDVNLYNQGPIPVAYLVEGNFTSLYKNRLAPTNGDTAPFIERSIPTKIVVVGSGNLLLNAVSPKDQQPLPWGYDPFLQQQFANQDFVCNMIDYMLAEKGLINAKRKTIHLRPLDVKKVAQERLYWQLFSLLSPLTLLVVGGIGWHMFRKQRYASNHE
jgi:ABC-2 type transport system permease protein